MPPLDRTAGHPDAAARIRVDLARLAARALRVAIDADPTIETRYDEAGLRHLLRDAELLAERVALCVEAGDPRPAHDYAEWTAPVYRRRRVPMDDLVAIAEGLREASESAVARAERAPLEAAIDEAIGTFRWYRRLAGDARKRNRILQFLYKGA